MGSVALAEAGGGHGQGCAVPGMRRALWRAGRYLYLVPYSISNSLR